MDRGTKNLLAEPQILTRGFIYVKENLDIVKNISEISKKIIEDNTETGRRVDFTKIKNDVREELGHYFYAETGCIPMIITVVTEI